MASTSTAAGTRRDRSACRAPAAAGTRRSRRASLNGGVLLVLVVAAAALPAASARRRSLAAVRVLGSTAGVTEPVTRTYEPEPKLVEGLVQAGFPKERAFEALRNVGNENCCGPQIEWLFKHSVTKHRHADAKSLQCNAMEATDYDGYALKWGSAHRQPDAAACCNACRNYEPVPPHYWPCNIWVFCPEETCFAPAAGTFDKHQCWLKYQEDPANPHVNMRGDYSAEYRRTHPAAPARVQWVAGSLTPPGVAASNGTWSSRSHW